MGDSIRITWYSLATHQILWCTATMDVYGNRNTRRLFAMKRARDKRLFVARGRNGVDMCIVDSAGQKIDFGYDVGRIKCCLATVGDGVETQVSTLPDAGYGLFATRDFEPCEIVTFYDGAVGGRIPVTEIEASYRTHARRINSYYTLYGNYTTQGTPIDLATNGAKGMGGGAFMNALREDEGGGTNCAWYVIRSHQNMSRFDSSEDPFQIVNLIYTKSAIVAGSEIFVDYGQDYWRDDTDDTEKENKKKPQRTPAFITREIYYSRLKNGEPPPRVVTRVTPTFISPLK